MNEYLLITMMSFSKTNIKPSKEINRIIPSKTQYSDYLQHLQSLFNNDKTPLKWWYLKK